MLLFHLFSCSAKPDVSARSMDARWLCHADEPKTVVYTGLHTQSKRGSRNVPRDRPFSLLPFFFLFVCLFVCFSRRVRAGPDADASEQLNSFFNFSFGNKFYFLGPERTICI